VIDTQNLKTITRTLLSTPITQRTASVSISLPPLSTQLRHRFLVRRRQLRHRVPRRQMHLDLTRVPPEEPGHGGQHQHGVEHIQRPLGTEQIPVVPAAVLDNTEDIPDHDEPRRDVQHIQHALPGYMGARLRLPAPTEGHVEVQRRDDEDAEHGDLDDQPADDDVLARLHAVRPAAGHQPGTRALDQEAEHVAADEDLGQQAGRDHAVPLGLDGADEPAEGHVEGRCEEDGGEEDEDGLDQVRA
jgi:hypothetical protein